MGKLKFFHFLLLDIAELSGHFSMNKKYLNPKFGKRLLEGFFESLKKIVAILSCFLLSLLNGFCYQVVAKVLVLNY